MSEKVNVVCDTCGKEEEIEKHGNIKETWYWIKTLHIEWKDTDETTHEIDIDEDDDPDFCSEKCVLAWFKKQLKILQTQD